MLAEKVRLLRFLSHLVDESHVPGIRSVTDVARPGIREERVPSNRIYDRDVTVKFRKIGFDVFEGLRTRVTARKGEQRGERDKDK